MFAYYCNELKIQERNQPLLYKKYSIINIRLLQLFLVSEYIQSLPFQNY